MELNAYKMDGLGNDFIIIDRRENPISLTKEKIIKLGSRDNIGFDQMIFIDKGEEDTFPIKIFNSDGGEVSACGNGARCVAYLLGKKLNIKEIKLKTNNRILNAKLVGNLQVKLEMGKPLFDYTDIPLSKKINSANITLEIGNREFTDGFCVNIGNPHIVFFIDDCFKYNLKEIGPLIENHELFPEKINVTFAQIKESNNILVNVWERGAGLTKACGTAACATGVAAFEKKISGNNNNIHFKGGYLNVEYDRVISMTGPVSEIKELRINL